MGDALRLQGYREPLGTWTRRVPPPGRHPDLRAYRFEYSSRGDRVQGRLWVPRTGGEHPLVLLQHGALDTSREGPSPEAACEPWLDRGAAVASVDLPLHGARRDQKLASRLAERLAAGPDGGADGLLVEFARQAVIDLERALDALLLRDDIDAERVAFVGSRLGAMIGAAFCALDPRPRAAVLALGGAGLAPRGIDPSDYVGRFAPRPLLLVNAARDASITRAAAEALHRAARPPVEQLWLDAGDEALSDEAQDAMWAFLAPVLDLSAR